MSLWRPGSEFPPPGSQAGPAVPTASPQPATIPYPGEERFAPPPYTAPEIAYPGGGMPPPPPSKWPKRRKWIKRGIYGFLIFFVLTLLWLAITAPLSRSLQPIGPPSITLVSAQGKAIARKGAVIDKPVKIADLPKHVPQAFIAIEDRRFYSHWGFDPRGFGRAMWVNIKSGAMRQGGSTITQQLAKGSFLDSDQNLGRKGRELLISFWLEAWLSKDEILERYLSNVYFGDNCYGLRAASLHYFNKQPEKLNVAQAAMLAGLLKAPSRLAPTQNLKAAQARAELVEKSMVEAGFITELERKALAPVKLNVRPLPNMTTGTYFADWAMAEASDRAGAVYENQKVVTTLDDRLQRLAIGAAARAPLGKAQVAIVVMRPDGAVVAMVGGKSYKDSPFNRATQARRLPGSTFKLFVYLAALRSGMTPESMVENSKLTTGEYRPENYGKSYSGPITLKQAFAQSSNVAAVRLTQQVGVSKVVKAARDLGISTPMDENYSLALGTSGVSLLELTSAYASVASGSYPVEAHALPPEEEGWSDMLWDRQSSYPSGQLADLREMMGAAVNSGTGRAARLRIPAFGKTGTTQDGRDAFFVGYAGGLVTGVWVGNDDNSPIRGLTGGGMPARIWRDFMGSALNAGAVPSTPREVPADEGIETPEASIDNVSASLEGGNISIDGQVGGVDLNLQIDRDGVRLKPGQAPDLPTQPNPERAPPPNQPRGEPRPPDPQQ